MPGLNIPHLSQSKSGIFRYRRRVPVDAMKHFGKCEIKKSLGTDRAVAMRRYTRLDRWFETELTKARSGEPLSLRDSTIQALKASGLNNDDLQLIEEKDSGYQWLLREIIAPDLVDQFDMEDDAGNEHKVSKEVIEAVFKGEIPAQIQTLSSALNFYLEQKEIGLPQRDKQLANSIALLEKRLIECLDTRRVNVRPLKDFTRLEAREFADHLLLSLKPTSVRRTIRTLSAAINLTIYEHDLNFRNRFERLTIKDSGSHRDQRKPLSEQDMVALEAAMLRHEKDLFPVSAQWTYCADCLRE
ncbi:MAG: DUF6538 domain-containing protein [Hyphomicrobiales bacterium]